MKKVNLYTIESYGADYSVEHLDSMYKREDLVLPDFQRKYVWTIQQASLFVESCMIGLPVPPIFLFSESQGGRYLVVDGQQRILTLVYFRRGLFKDETSAFKLTGVADDYNGLAYDELPDELRRRLDYAILRVTIFKQTQPNDGMDSVYEVFSRLNTGGRKLTSHEVRNAIFRGAINPFLAKLNDNLHWRVLFGKKIPDQHMKDEEFILRFLALHDNLGQYSPPMNLFLNSYMDTHKDDSQKIMDTREKLFNRTVESILIVLGKNAFRLESTINAAVCDSLMVAFAKNLTKIPGNEDKIAQRYGELKIDDRFIDSVKTGTSHARRVNDRINLVVSRLFEDLA